jgi:hypothetical protein
LKAARRIAIAAAPRVCAGLAAACALALWLDPGEPVGPPLRSVPNPPDHHANPRTRREPQAIKFPSGPAIASDPSAFAVTVAPGLPPGERQAKLNALYYEWARQEPELALQAASRIADPGDRSFAFESVLSGWSRGDPAELAEVALRFPEGDLRTSALTKSIRAWLIADPWAAGDWIGAHPSVVPVVEFIVRNENR